MTYILIAKIDKDNITYHFLSLANFLASSGKSRYRLGHRLGLASRQLWATFGFTPQLRLAG